MTRTGPILLALLLTLAAPLRAVQPDEVMADPALEARARSISQLLRCPVCQGENIDESGAPVARDLRLFVRERLLAGGSDDQVIDDVIARFGEFVLFQPRAAGSNLILWVAGPAMLAFALAVAAVYLRGRRAAAEPAPGLSPDESARLDAILKD